MDKTLISHNLFGTYVSKRIWDDIICIADHNNFFLKYKLCHAFGVKCDAVRNCLLFNVSSVPPG